MTTTFIFTGQGNVYPGMFREVGDDPVVRRRFAVADRVAEWWGMPAPSAYCRMSAKELDGDENECAKILALLTGEVAVAEALAARGHRPHLLAAHSFGEYAALVVSGILPFEDACEMVLFRESISPSAHERGYLLAVNEGAEWLEAHLEGNVFEISNRNHASQTVIAARWDALIDIEMALAKTGTGYKRLNTSQPFHSSYLEDTRDMIARWVKQRSFRPQPPRLPFFSSVLSDWVRPGERMEERLSEILANQMVREVNFIRALMEIGPRCERLIEVGPVRLLEHFAREILGKSHQIASGRHLLVEGDEWHVNRNEGLSTEGIYGKIMSSIARVTGYRLESIRIEDRLQEDLGIDSIKATEIVIDVLRDSEMQNVSFASFRRASTVGELVSAISSNQFDSPLTVARVPCFGLYRRGWKASSSPTKHEEARGEKVVIRCGETDHHPLAILREWQIRFSGETKNLVLLGREGSASFRAAVAAGKSLKKEGVLRRFKAITWEKGGWPGDSLIDEELADGDEEEVRWDVEGRKIPHFEKLSLKPGNSSFKVIASLGGARGITREQILCTLGKNPGASIIFCGRSQENDQAVTEAIKAFESAGASVVRYRSLDAAEPGQVENFLDGVKARHGVPDLIIVGTGVELSSGFLQKEESAILSEWASKYLPARCTLDWTSRPGQTTRVILTSSLIGHFGNRGQAVYGFSNALVEGLAANRPGVVAIAWPPWENVGMTSRPEVLASLRATGLGLLKVADARSLFDSILDSNVEGVIAVRDPADDAIYRAELWDFTAAEPVLGALFMEGGLPRFMKIYSATVDPEIRDHQLKGRYLFPAALAAAVMLFCHRRILRGSLSIQHFSVIRPAGSESGTFASELAFTPQASGFGYSLSCGSGRFIAESGSSELDESASSESPSLLRKESVPLYGKGGRLFHGSCFQVLRELRRDEAADRWSATFQLPSTAPLGGNEWGRLTQWIDGTLQLAAIALVGKFQTVSLPIGFESLALKEDVLNHQVERVTLEGISPTADGGRIATARWWIGRGLVGEIRGIRLLEQFAS